MDSVLLRARERSLPVKRFGPTLAKFHDQRRWDLEAKGHASITVECAVTCRVVVDEQVAEDNNSGPIFLGTHRVWVEATQGDAETEHFEVVLDADGATETLEFPTAPVAEPEPEPEPEPACETPAGSAVTQPKRILPLWAEISVAVIGIGAVVAGGVMLGLDGKCPGGLDPVGDAAQCPEIYEGTVPGLVAVGIGSALVLTGTIVIAVDQVRVGKQRGRQATIGWKMHF